MSYGEEAASQYEDDFEHMLPQEEAEAWLAEMARWTAGRHVRASRLLDVGAGTGLLTAVMKEAGYAVQALEQSLPMIQVAVTRHPSLRREEFFHGDADNADCFPQETFDWILSRQLLCHLTEPNKAFHAWFGWLKPGGHIMVVDGFWRRSSWKPGALASQPFAAVREADELAEAISSAGFTVLKAGPFEELNDARAARFPATVDRYLVLARR